MKWDDAKQFVKLGDMVEASKRVSGEENIVADDYIPEPLCKDDYTYRVRIEGGVISIMCFGLPTVDSNCEGDYDGVDALPDWVQDRLAILMMTPTTRPTSDIPTVGRRISGNVFWVYAPTTP